MNSTSVATGITSVGVYEAGDWLGSGTLALLAAWSADGDAAGE